MRKPPPASLAKRGLLRATSNVGPGQAVVLPGSLLLAFFEDELREAMTKGKPCESKARR